MTTFSEKLEVPAGCNAGGRAGGCPRLWRRKQPIRRRKAPQEPEAPQQPAMAATAAPAMPAATAMAPKPAATARPAATAVPGSGQLAVPTSTPRATAVPASQIDLPEPKSPQGTITIVIQDVGPRYRIAPGRRRRRRRSLGRSRRHVSEMPTTVRAPSSENPGLPRTGPWRPTLATLT